MRFILDIIKGILMGIANIIPGVSGGTMAVSLGIFDRLISAITHLFKDFKKSVMTLLPIGLGLAIGIVGFSYGVEYLLKAHTLPTCLAFVGLILGGLPVLLEEMKDGMKEQGGKLRIRDGIAFFVLFAVAIVLPLLQGSNSGLTSLSPTPGMMLTLFFIGVIAAGTMIIPGVSGSLVMMILGYYYGIINTITDFLTALKNMDFEGLKTGFLLLFPFGIGVLVGIGLVAKLIDYLFQKQKVATYSAIIGLIIASPFAIFYNTGALGKPMTISSWLIGLALFIICALVTYALGKKKTVD